MTAARHRDRGFTLIELLVVIIIIGILSAIAVPAYHHQRRKADRRASDSDALHAAKVIQTYLTDRDNLDAVTSLDLTALGYRSSPNNGGTYLCRDWSSTGVFSPGGWVVYVEGNRNLRQSVYDSDAGGLLRNVNASVWANNCIAHGRLDLHFYF